MPISKFCHLTHPSYKHGVIKNLISEDLLRDVRSEIQENISFTPKETDIYRIHQSGDLANLDGLDDSSLKRLPSLLRLRDALYSEKFRTYLTQITEAGPLSGKKTDMAVNVYTPGCHLLCHDDVIGSRRVSYILYLTDPENPWKEEWGGALRLYPTQTHTAKDERCVKVPSPDSTVSIPPSFGQLSFFAVQPGESFHDVEEVYAHGKGDETDGDGDEKRVRMAISGWYHIPQEGEEGFIPGLEEKLAEQSSLQQLQGKADEYDLPQPAVTQYDASSDKQGKREADTKSSLEEAGDDQSLTEEELEFLLKYLAPTYLTPDTLGSVSEAFTDHCSLCLENILSKKFAEELRESIQLSESTPLPTSTAELEDKTSWKVARPPHKHRFLFQQPSNPPIEDPTSRPPLHKLLHDLLPSKPFRKWLQLATGQTIRSHNLLARRFRRGKDYTLATGYEEDNPRLELTLSITPTPGWEEDDDNDETTTGEPSPAVGGYLAYIAGDEDNNDGAAGSDHGVEVPTDMSTGGRASAAMNATKRPKADPAVYQAAAATAAEDEDGGVLFSMPASWNRMGLVLRDRGTMRFVKYVSALARGDRWDVVGEFELEEEEEDDRDDDEDDDDDDDEGNEKSEGAEEPQSEGDRLTGAEIPGTAAAGDGSEFY